MNTDGVRKYICDTMRDSCSTTWEANGYDSTGLATCIDDLESLPMGWNAVLYGADPEATYNRKVSVMHVALKSTLDRQCE